MLLSDGNVACALTCKNDLPSTGCMAKLFSKMPKDQSQQHDSKLNARHGAKCTVKTIYGNPRDDTVRKCKRKKLFDCIDHDQSFKCNREIGVDD